MKDTTPSLPIPASPEAPEGRALLDKMINQGVHRILAQALEAELQDWLTQRKDLRDEKQRALVTRNGHHRTRTLQTTSGPVDVSVPRAHDRRSPEQGRERYLSKLLPPYLRRTANLDALIPSLYLRGISTSAMIEALAPILGDQARSLSANVVQRLAEAWHAEYTTWQSRSLTGKEYLYFWIDGIYSNVRLSDDRPCLLIIIGVLVDGTKEVVSIVDGERESKASWSAVLQDLKARGLEKAPRLCIGDGALGFWAALEEVWPQSRTQRCWVHKIANILDKLPKGVQPTAKQLLHEIMMAETKAAALSAYQAFCERYEAKYPKAVACLTKDKEAMLTFYDFPAEHWKHIRTTNPIESSFATIRHRHRQTKGNGNRAATLAMIYKLAIACEGHWRKLHAAARLAEIIENVVFIDGTKVQSQAA
jgi:putative transposase